MNSINHIGNVNKSVKEFLDMIKKELIKQFFLFKKFTDYIQVIKDCILVIDSLSKLKMIIYTHDNLIQLKDNDIRCEGNRQKRSKW